MIYLPDRHLTCTIFTATQRIYKGVIRLCGPFLLAALPQSISGSDVLGQGHWPDPARPGVTLALLGPALGSGQRGWMAQAGPGGPNKSYVPIFKVNDVKLSNKLFLMFMDLHVRTFLLCHIQTPTDIL